MSKHIKLDIRSKESFKKTFAKLNYELFKISNPKMGDVVYRTTEFIAKTAYENYKNSHYNGRIDAIYAGEKGETYVNNSVDVAVGFGFVDSDYTMVRTRRTRFVPSLGCFKAEKYWATIPANYTLHYRVNVSGAKSWLLEFGSGERFSPTEYSGKVGATAWSFTKDRSKHFKSRKTNKETWVYKGEQGNKPYKEDGGNVKSSWGKPVDRPDYFYSAGNEPQRCLEKAVSEAKKEVLRFVKEAKVYK